MMGRCPYLSKRKRLAASEEELSLFNDKVKAYYSNLPFDVSETDKAERYYRFVAKIVRTIAFLKGVTVLNAARVEETDARIFTANHIGSFDQFYIPSLLGLRPLHYLVKSKVMNWKIRWHCVYKPTGVIVVSPGSLSSWQKAKEEIAKLHVENRNIFIFAEGTRGGKTI